MRVTEAQLAAIAGGRPNPENMRSIAAGLNVYGGRVGLNRPHRLAHFLAQLAHESGGFKFDRELWGPTPAQKRYDTRTDLGNTAALDGDGYRYRGRGPIQITGAANYAKLTAWARQAYGSGSPDFEREPDKVNTDPWELLSAVWYWDSGNPTAKSLNVLADVNDAAAITRRINGGLNGFDDRLRFYARAGLVLLGYGAEEVRRFQGDVRLTVDGEAGPATRATIHKMLVAMPSGAIAEPSAPVQPQEPPAAPVVVPVEVIPVEPAEVDDAPPDRLGMVGAVLGVLFVLAIIAAVVLLK